MRLIRSVKLLKIWERAFDQGANVVLIRHAPKAGSDNSDVSEKGKRLAIKYGNFFRESLIFVNWDPVLFCTAKMRTQQTLKLLFPSSNPLNYRQLSDLRVNKVTPFVQDQVNKFHKTVGRFKSYCPTHTYYFLEKLGGKFDEENIHTVVAKRMAKGIESLFDFGRTVIYCGHSPSIEVGLEKLLRIKLPEFGGFLNPLDSIHLRKRKNRIELVARINPIVGYIDAENETYFK